MPKQSDNSTAVSGNERLLRQNLAKIKKIRASKNQRLTELVDAMEEEMTRKLGEDGYQDMLSRTPLETIMKRFEASNGGKRATGSSKNGNENKEQTPARTHSDAEEDDYDRPFRYSSDVEQSLMEERRNAGNARRREIDEELDAIHASRLAHQANDELFDDFMAEDALKKHLEHKASSQSRQEEASGTTSKVDPPSSPSVSSSGIVGTNPDGNGDHSDDFNPNVIRGQGEMASSYAPASASPGTSTSGVPVAPPMGESAGDPPKLETDLHVGSEGDELTRGSLEDDFDRGQLNDDQSLDQENKRRAQEQMAEQQEAKKEQEKEKAKKRRKILMKVAMHFLATCGPILLVIFAILMLAKCVDELNPFSGSGGSAADVTNVNGVTVGTEAAGTSTASSGGATAVTRRNTSSAIPNVYVDPALNDMFAETASEDEEEEGEEEDDGELTDAQQRVIQACKTTPSPGAGWCAAWVGDVFANANVGVTFRGDARDWFHAFCKSASPYDGGTVSASTPKEKRNYSTLKPGMIIAVPSSSSGTEAGRIYGHVGIYIGNHTVAHNIGSIEEWDLDRWVDTYGQYTDVGWGWADGIKLGGSGKKSGGSEKITDALNLHISSKKDIQKWAKKIDKYLAGHGAVRMGFKGEYFAEAAAQYGIDPRLSAAQSCIEQARGDVINTGDYYNLWGWGWYPGSNGLIHTSNARDACFKHAKGLSDVYGPSFGPAQVEIYCPGNTGYWDWLKKEAQTITDM